jgi:bacillithiol biosynthesis cysteine-adding enzyme BshC
VAGALIAEGPAVRGCEELLNGSALAVTTGQQAGLFTGPLYTIYKGLTAAAFAEALSEAWARPVVPLFWVAGDDHDFAEINHCDVLSVEGRVERVVLRERPAEAAMLPAYREPVGANGEVLARLESLLPPSEFRAGVLEWLGRAYAPERSVAEACALALAELLGRYGVVVCRGWHGAVKAAAAPVFRRGLELARELDASLAREAKRLRATGVTPPVEVGDGMALVMIEAAQGRDRLRLAGDGRFEARRSGERFSREELEGILAAQPERVSGNVLLRPAVEAHAFPTVAYVGGPAEMTYLAQAGSVFETLDVPRPARLSRLSGALIEAKVDKVLERHGLSPEDLARPEGELASRIVRSDLPQGATRALAALRAALEERYGAVRNEAAAIDRTLERTVESARNQALVAAAEIERKLVHHLKRQNETLVQQLARAREQLYPEGRPQERVLTVASFLARHGTAVLDLVRDAARDHAGRLLEALWRGV